MMKTLYLVRHAKSSWEHPGLSDAERPLMEKGILKSQDVIRYLKKRGVVPDKMISSPAVRAYETARIFAKGLGYPETGILVEPIIYEGYYDNILDIIYAADNNTGSLMLFGHNPTITNLANLFLHPGIEIMPTSSVVAIGFKTEKWEDIPGARTKFEFFVTPKTAR